MKLKSKYRIIKRYHIIHKDYEYIIQRKRWWSSKWKDYYNWLDNYFLNGFHTLEKAKEYMWRWNLELYPEPREDEVVYET